MSCIQLQSPLFVLHPKLIHRQRLRMPEPLWLSSKKPTHNKLQQFQYYSRGGNINAIINNPIWLGSTYSKPVEISEFLLVSVLLIALYFISNFIVPDLITKRFELYKKSENQKHEDEDEDDP